MNKQPLVKHESRMEKLLLDTNKSRRVVNYAHPATDRNAIAVDNWATLRVGMDVKLHRECPSHEIARVISREWCEPGVNREAI